MSDCGPAEPEDDLAFVEITKPGWMFRPDSADRRDRMVAAAMTWHREHAAVPWHELIGEARMRELVEAILEAASDAG